MSIIAASAIAGGAALATGALGGWLSKKNTDSVNETNREIAEQNLAFQREQLEYQKALQQQIFEREDTAYQRTVSDMRAAGLSPLSMQSPDGAGEAIQTSALHNDYQEQKQSYGEQILAAAPQVASILGDLAKGDAEVDLINAQKNKIDAETADIIFKSGIDKDFYFTEKNQNKNMQELLLEQIRNKNDIDWYSLEKIKRENDFDKAFGNTLRMENLKNAMLDTSNKMEDYTEKSRFNNWARQNNIFSAMTPEERKAMLVANALGLNKEESSNGIGKTIAGLFGLDFLQGLYQSAGKFGKGR